MKWNEMKLPKYFSTEMQIKFRERIKKLNKSKSIIFALVEQKN